MEISSQYDVAIARKTRDVQELQGKAAVDLIQTTAEVAQAIQPVKAPHTNVGTMLNFYA